jgi:hypothetical protein
MNKLKSMWVWAAIVCVFAGIAWAGDYSGGDGTSITPYEIGNVDDWQELIDTPGDWGMEFVLIADIDFEGQTLAPVAPDTSPAHGFQGDKFTGTLNGDGFTLKNAVISQPTQNYVGVFGYVGTSGQILNLRVKNFTVSGQSWVGLLAGENAGTIEGCQALGSVFGNGEYTGGLVGYPRRRLDQPRQLLLGLAPEQPQPEHHVQLRRLPGVSWRDAAGYHLGFD